MESTPSQRFDVVLLRCADRNHIDPTPLTLLFAQKTLGEADAIICAVLETISARLDTLQKGIASGQVAPMLAPARSIATIAAQLGLTEVSVAAEHVAVCVRVSDRVALEATLARLERGFDQAVTEVWQFRRQ
jgi:hypothetical protein